MKLYTLIIGYMCFSLYFPACYSQYVSLDEVKALISDEIIEAEYYLRKSEYPTTARSYWIGRLQCASDLHETISLYFNDI